jgi:hypothetical protein
MNSCLRKAVVLGSRLAEPVPRILDDVLDGIALEQFIDNRPPPVCPRPATSEKVVMTPATSGPSEVRSMPSVHRTSRVCTARCSSKPTYGPAGRVSAEASEPVDRLYGIDR